MTEPKAGPPRDDAELAARIEAATRPEPWTPPERARFRAGVVARTERGAHGGAWRWLAAASLAAAAAAGAALLLAAPKGEVAPAQARRAEPALDPFAESYEERVLFAPEWIERDAGFVDGDVLPDSYALASELTES